MTDAQYIGSLVVEKIKPKPKGDPSIEMIISSNADGEIVADAVDLDTAPDGEHYVLTVSLKSLEESSHEMEIPDFELESNEEPPSGLYNQAAKIREDQKRKPPAILILLIILFIVLGLAAAWLLLFGGLDIVKSILGRPKTEQSASPAVSQNEPVRQETVSQSEPVAVVSTTPAEPVRETAPVVQQAAEPAPVIQAPAEPPPVRTQTASRVRPSAPVASYNVPAVIPREGVEYRIRWGDTLWDISEAFYRNPWLYRRIAQHNGISNPNHIISGRTLRIPPRN
jgi:hypothetical protein